MAETEPMACGRCGSKTATWYAGKSCSDCRPSFKHQPFAPVPKEPRPPCYKPAVLDCPTCGAHVEGDLAVISHGIMGCESRKT